jgi:3-oxoacyl-[acyl-carrier-protein] synthase-3
LQHALIVGAETLSRVVNPEDRGTCILFGDAASGVVLSRGTASDGPGLLAWDLGCDGSATGLLEIPAGGSRLPTSPETLATDGHYLHMAGQEVFRRAVRVVVESSAITLARAGVDADAVDWFIPHQANIRIIEAAGKRLNIPMDKTIVNIDQYGNTSAASIPLALTEAADAGRFEPGQLVLVSGFGAGMAWASALIRWGTA